jgi:Fungal chitosanase of glycosyl hydrolase group 75
MILATIKNVHVFQDPENQVGYWDSGAAVDADGSNGQNGKPFAYRYPDNDGLDSLSDAGYPNGSWGNVLLRDGSGHPLTDGNGNAYSSTAYSWPGRPYTTRYLDACSIPYIVINPIVRLHAHGVVLGCQCEVSYEGKTIGGVVGDVSGEDDIGELSVFYAQLLGIPDSPRTGGVTEGVHFVFYPGIPAVINGETYRLIPA